MTVRALYLFEHESALGNAPAHKLFERVTVSRKPGVDVARSFSDYDVQKDETELPVGVEIKDIL